MPRPEYVHVHLKPGFTIRVYRNQMDLYDCMHMRGSAYMSATINKECTVPMLRMANTGMSDAYFYYTVLPAQRLHPVYGMIAGWGYWEYKLISL